MKEPKSHFPDNSTEALNVTEEKKEKYVREIFQGHNLCILVCFNYLHTKRLAYLPLPEKPVQKRLIYC